MSPPQRMRVWGASVAGGHLVLGTIAAVVLQVPGSEIFFGLCAVTTLLLSLVAAPLLRPRGEPGGDDPPDDDPPPPPWWPQFEREFRRYADRRSRTTA